MIAGAMGGVTTAGISGGNVGQGAWMGAAFGFGTGLAGWGVSEAFGNVGRQIFDSSVVLASGAIGYSQGNMEGFLGGIAGSSLVTGIAASGTYGAASSVPEAPQPQGFWDTAWDIISFGYSLKQFNDNPGWGTGLGLLADTLALLAPGVPGGAGFAAKAIGRADDVGDAAKTFRGGKYVTKTLTKDVEAYRFFGGEVGPAGRYLTTRQTLKMIGSPNSARSILKLPEGNLATDMGKFIIPKGTTVYIGRVEGGAQKATQIFIKDASVLRKVD